MRPAAAAALLFGLAAAALLAGSLERGLNLAEAMEARGYGRAGRTRIPPPPWRRRDQLSLVAAAGLVVVGALWL